MLNQNFFMYYQRPTLHLYNFKLTEANFVLFYSKTKFVCANVECPSYFKHLTEPCYYQYDRDSCCEINTYCRKYNSFYKQVII